MTSKEQQVGKKFDTGKSSARRGVLEYFPRAILEVGKLSCFGAEKYDWDNWEFVEDAINRYGDAEIRHICEAAISGETDPESGLLHAVHAAWNALAVLEMKLREKEVEEQEKEERQCDMADAFQYIWKGFDMAKTPCEIIQPLYSDQMVCGHCDMAWDVNDEHPPKCPVPPKDKKTNIAHKKDLLHGWM